MSTTTTTHSDPPASSHCSSPDLLEPGDRMSRPEFLRRYQQMPDRSDIQLVEGVVHMGSPVSAEGHGAPHSDLIAWLVVYKAHVPGLETGDNSTLHLDLENAPQPDCYLRIREEHGGQSTLRDGYVTGPPELIAEVASSSVSYDLHDKKHAYQRNGVLEYIVWRTRDRAIDWFVLTNGRYETLPASEDGILKSQVFPGLWLDPAAMLSHDMKRVLSVLQMGLAHRETSAQSATQDP